MAGPERTASGERAIDSQIFRLFSRTLNNDARMESVVERELGVSTGADVAGGGVNPIF